MHKFGVLNTKIREILVINQEILSSEEGLPGDWNRVSSP